MKTKKSKYSLDLYNNPYYVDELNNYASGTTANTWTAVDTSAVDSTSMTIPIEALRGNTLKSLSEILDIFLRLTDIKRSRNKMTLDLDVKVELPIAKGKDMLILLEDQDEDILNVLKSNLLSAIQDQVKKKLKSMKVLRSILNSKPLKPR